MREFLKIELNNIDKQAYEKAKKRLNSFVFSVELPIQKNKNYVARIIEENGNILHLEIDGLFEQIGTEIPFSKLAKNSEIYILDSPMRKTQKICANATVKERFFEAAQKEKRIAEEIKPLTSSNSKTVELSLTFSKNEFKWIKLGRTPKSMDIKWHIYYEKETLHFLRAWNSLEVFRVKIIKHENKYHINSALVNTETENYNDIELLKSILKHMAKTGEKIFDK